MPRSFLMKKHPNKKSDDQFDPNGYEHVMDTRTDSETLDVVTPGESSRGPFDLTNKASKEEDEPAKTTPCTPDVIESSPKIVPDYNALIIPSKPSVPSRPTPSHIQEPVPMIYEQPYLGHYGRSSFMPPHRTGFHSTRDGKMQRVHSLSAAGHWRPREGTPDSRQYPDNRQSLLESASGKPLGEVSSSSSSSHPPRYDCDKCNKSCETQSGLARHKQLHCLTKKSLSCKYCGKLYLSSGALKMHIYTHTLPCKCTLCGKAFSRKWLLENHMRTHTGEKPFACPHCNWAFAERSNLRAHLETHSDIKKYKCQSCSKTFSRMSQLSKHTDGGCNTIRDTDLR